VVPTPRRTNLRVVRRGARLIGRALVAVAVLCALLSAAGAAASPANPAAVAAPQGLRPDPAPPPPGIAARELEGPSASQAWEFAAKFESGHFLFVRFLITNAGPGDSNAAAIWHVIQPDGVVREFRNGRREHEWSLEDAGYRLRVGSSLLTLRGWEQGVSIDKKKVQIHIRFQLPARFEDEVSAGGQRLGLVSLATPVDGSLWYRGMDTPVAMHGWSAITQSYEARAGAALRRFEFLSFERDQTLFVSEVLDDAGARRGWAWFGTPGELVRSNAVAVCASSRGAYSHPQRLVATIPVGQVNVEVEEPFLRYDPLSALPKAFRTVLAWFQSPQRVWAWGSYEIDGTSEHGRGVARLTFNDSIPDSMREGRAITESPVCRRESAS